MKWVSALLGVLASILLAGFLKALLLSKDEEGDVPASGMSLIEAHRCGPAETKRVAIRGVEDDYSSAGAEPARVHPRIVHLHLDVRLSDATFDSVPTDAYVTDFFEIPSHTASGLIVIKMRSNGDNNNDNIAIGDFATRVRSTPSQNARVYNEELRRLAGSKRWKNVRDLYWVSMANLPLNSGGTLLDLIHAAPPQGIIDISIGDDTAVDFFAAAVCEAPKMRAGVTLVYREAQLPATNRYATFACKGVAGMPDCNPYAGDRSCSSSLPFLCHIDRNLAAPHSDTAWTSNDATRAWTGGEVAASPPVAGDRFKTIAQADAYCASQFGAGWRVAEWHMGGSGWNLTARSGGRTFAGHYWIDIRNQPYGTCWRRDDDAG